MLRVIASCLLATALSVRAAPFPQATGTPTVPIEDPPVSVTQAPTPTVEGDLVTLSGVEVTSPTNWMLFGGNQRLNGANLVFTRSDTTFIGRLATFPGYLGVVPTGASTTITRGEALDVSPTRVAIAAINPSLPDALNSGLTCDVQGTMLNCTYLEYGLNNTDIEVALTALYEVAPTGITGAPIPTGTVLNEVVDNDQLAALFASALSRLEGDAMTVNATGNYISYRDEFQSSLFSVQSEYFATANAGMTTANGVVPSPSQTTVSPTTT